LTDDVRGCRPQGILRCLAGVGQTMREAHGSGPGSPDVRAGRGDRFSRIPASRHFESAESMRP
jgi:hypothetical protein